MSVGELKRAKVHQKEEFTEEVLENIHFFQEQAQLWWADVTRRTYEGFLSNHLHSSIAASMSEHCHDFFRERENAVLNIQ